MKTIILIVLAVMFGALAQAEDYRESLNHKRERLRALEAERSDYRKNMPGLSAELENERLVLIAQLMTEDPIKVLLQQVELDLQAVLARTHTRTDAGSADMTLIMTLKEFLAIIAGAVDLPSSQRQAAEFAMDLRDFVVRRDLVGVRAWSKSHRQRGVLPPASK